MKVLLINGSPNEKGCTYTALTQVAETLHTCGIDTEIVQIGKCILCRYNSLALVALSCEKFLR